MLLHVSIKLVFLHGKNFTTTWVEVVPSNTGKLEYRLSGKFWLCVQTFWFRLNAIDNKFYNRFLVDTIQSNTSLKLLFVSIICLGTLKPRCYLVAQQYHYSMKILSHCCKFVYSYFYVTNYSHVIKFTSVCKGLCCTRY